MRFAIIVVRNFTQKCAGVNDGRITWIDRLFCKPCIDGIIKNESEDDIK